MKQSRRIRRDFLQAGLGLTAAALSPIAAGPTHAADSTTLDRLRRGERDPKRRVLFKGGTVISIDAKTGDHVRADVLVEGKKIAAIGPDLKAAEAQIIDASRSILIPGFVDAHRHAWEGQIRGIIPNAASLADYAAATHRGFALHYRPHDMYVGNLITALGCIDAGITCILDNSHNSRTAAHSDAAIQALLDSGIRAVHASGAPQVPPWEGQWPGDLVRLKKRFFSSDDQLVTLRMFAGLNPEHIKLARDLDLWVTSEFSGGAAGEEALRATAAAGLLGARHTLNHCSNVTDAGWKLIREAGVKVNVCPTSDPHYRLGTGLPGLQHALDNGIRPGLSVDNEASYGTDMFTQMRVGFYLQRAMAGFRAFNKEANVPAPMQIRDMLEFATLRGAECCGLIDKVGSLAPGKEADIVMIRADAINTLPLTSAVATVVFQAHAANIDTVMIGGQVRKFLGKLVGVDARQIAQMVEASRDELIKRRGYKLDVLREAVN